MIRLTTTTQKLQIILAGAITTNQLPVSVAYSDDTGSAYTGGVQLALTNSATAVDICAAPLVVGYVRDIDYVNVQNADTAAATVTIRISDSGTLYTQFKVLLAVGDQLSYVHGIGWRVADSNGAFKNLSPRNYKLSDFAATTSAELATVISDETGSGLLVFGTSPTLITPILGVAAATSINKVIITAPATVATLTIAEGKTLTANNSITIAGTDGKTLTVSNSLTLAGTDATVMTFPTTSATVARTDAANSFTGTQTFSTGVAVGGATPGTGGVAFPATAVAVADANTLDDYEEGSFTGTSTGHTVAQNGTITYTLIGNSVIVDIPVFSGTSNATTFTITGFAAAIRPAASKVFSGIGVDNSGVAHAIRCQIDSGGTLTLSNTLDAGGAWTAAGTKQLQAFSACYTKV